MMKKTMLAMAAVLAMGTATAQAEGDAAAGAKVFNKCKACHKIEAGQKSPVGPNLHGVFGRTAGTSEDFTRYSSAMKDSGIVWSEETIAAYLADPKGYIPKNKMAFPGLKKEADIANIIAYLKEASQ
ncbi:MAG: c-type cytochrome [Minwuia sp.]|uniref:c-type cytochrome n=1 Tax=Minwuia sp. TaxID=2493630 RepID=UPI003A89FB54